jgi:hypothetical protein
MRPELATALRTVPEELPTELYLAAHVGLG